MSYWVQKEQIFFQRRLPGEGIRSNVIIGDVIAREQPAQIPCRNLLVEQLDNLVASLLVRDGIIATLFFPNDDLCCTKITFILRR